MLFYHNRIPYHWPGADPTPSPTSFSNFAFWRDDSFASVSFALSNEGPSISLSASRTTGVAPLAVFFDASATVDASTSQPFHDLGYSWNFNDPGSGNWLDGFSKNVAYGPVAAHVFEDPGTYNVTLTVTNGTQETSETVQIVADDPDSTYSGNDTIAIGQLTLPVAGVDGVPTGALCVTQSDWPTIVNTYALDNKRVLLKHDDTFTGAANTVLNNSGVTIGMYGTGAKPIIRTTGTANSSNILTTTGTVTSDDCRLMDLHFDGQSDVHRNGFTAVGGAYTLSRLLVLRCNFHDLGGGFMVSVGAATAAVPDQIFLVDCEVKRIKATSGSAAAEGVFTSGSRWGVLGNDLDDSLDVGGTAEHLLRVQSCDRGVFSHNSIKNVHDTKEMFALRAVEAPTGPFPSGFATEFVVVSHNVIETNTYAGIQVDTEAVAVPSVSVIRDILIESNYFERQNITANGAAIIVRANRVTVRNNIGNWQLGTASVNPLIIRGAGTPSGSNAGVASDVWHYNNSNYSSLNPSAVVLVQINGNNSTGIVVRNGILYCPSFTGTPATISDTGSGNSSVESNNLVTKTTDPLFTVTPPVDPADFALGVGSPCIDAGTAVPVFYDYLDSTRTSDAAMDQGAIES